MTVIAKSKYNLTTWDRDQLISQFQHHLKGRVKKAYIFGSFASGEIHGESDIDMILVVDDKDDFFTRCLKFSDVKDIYPAIDLLVYTEAELEKLLQEPMGFWKSVQESWVQIV